MPDKKSALTKPKAAAAAKPAPAKKPAPAARREPAAKKAPAPAKAAPKKAPPAPKATAAAAKTAPAKPAKPAPAAKKAQPKPVPKADVKAKKPAKPEAKAAKPAPKANAKAKPAPKPEPKAKAEAKPKAEAKKPELKAEDKKAKAKPGVAGKAAAPAPAAKPEKPAKPAKAPKPPKPPKLAPVEAAFSKPIPAKPLAVAAGRAQPIARTPVLAPVRPAAPKPLAAPKPVSEPELVGESKAVPAFKGKAGAAKGMVLVGAVAGAFGVKGEVRLRAFTGRKDGVISYGPLYGEDGKVLLKPKSWRELKDGVAVVAPEVKTREQAEALKGQKLFVPRANLPATAEDEFYIVDLLGSRAETLDGAVLGDIVAVWNFGAGDILEYKPANGGPNVRVTFTKETVPHVDLAAKRVVIDPPAPEPVGK